MRVLTFRRFFFYNPAYSFEWRERKLITVATGCWYFYLDSVTLSVRNQIKFFESENCRYQLCGDSKDEFHVFWGSVAKNKKRKSSVKSLIDCN